MTLAGRCATRCFTKLQDGKTYTTLLDVAPLTMHIVQPCQMSQNITRPLVEHPQDPWCWQVIFSTTRCLVLLIVIAVTQTVMAGALHPCQVSLTVAGYLAVLSDGSQSFQTTRDVDRKFTALSDVPQHCQTLHIAFKWLMVLVNNLQHCLISHSVIRLPWELMVAPDTSKQSGSLLYCTTLLDAPEFCQVIVRTKGQPCYCHPNVTRDWNRAVYST